MKTSSTAIIVFFSLLLCGFAGAQVPQLINYQGRVVVGATDFNGSGQFKFALVNSNGSTTYWSNDGTSTAGSQPTNGVTLTVTQGLYSLQLGNTALTNMTAIPYSVFQNNTVLLRIWFNDGTHGYQQLAPDQQIAAVGYSMIAATVPNGAITSAQIANGAVGANQLASGAVLSTLSGGSGTLNLGNFTLSLGTPSSGVLTNCTGLPISTGVAGLGANVAGALGVSAGTTGGFVVSGPSTNYQIICCTRGDTGGNSAATSTSYQELITGQTSATYRIAEYATATATNLRVKFPDSEEEFAGPNPITVKCSLEDSSGNIYPVWWSGQRTITLTPGCAFPESDPTGLNVTKGAEIFVRTYIVPSSGGSWIGGEVFNNSVFPGEGVQYGSDQTGAGGALPSPSANLGYGYMPVGVFGNVSPQTVFIGVVGDSETKFSMATNGGYDNDIFVNAFGPNLGENYPHVSVGQSGESFDGNSLGFFYNQNRILRTQLLQGVTDVIIEYAVVHLNTATATAESDLTNFATQLTNMGIRVHMCTILPQTSSTDGWTTTTNQTPLGQEAERIALNNWIRSRPAPFSNYFETANTCETSQNSGLWIPGYTVDGLHPDATGLAVETTAILPSTLSQ